MEFIKIITEKDILRTDGLSTFMPTPRIRGVLRDGDDLIALIYSKSHGYYTIPGGMIEKGESKENAFVREMLEETGCQCKILTELGYVIQLEQHHEKQDRAYISICFLAELIGEKGLPNWTEGEKNQNLSIEWHTLENAINLVKKTEPADYSGRFIKERDLSILQTAYDYLQGK